MELSKKTSLEVLELIEANETIIIRELEAMKRLARNTNTKVMLIILFNSFYEPEWFLHTILPDFKLNQFHILASHLMAPESNCRDVMEILVEQILNECDRYDNLVHSSMMFK